MTAPAGKAGASIWCCSSADWSPDCLASFSPSAAAPVLPNRWADDIKDFAGGALNFRLIDANTNNMLAE